MAHYSLGERGPSGGGLRSGREERRTRHTLGQALAQRELRLRQTLAATGAETGLPADFLQPGRAGVDGGPDVPVGYCLAYSYDHEAYCERECE